jgi:hypothetical protein
MTSHDFQDWQDNNTDPLPDNGKQAAINALRDIYNLTTENLPALAVAAKVQVIARAVLDRLGVPPDVEVEDLGGRAGLCFPDDETPFIGETLFDDEPPPF